MWGKNPLTQETKLATTFMKKYFICHSYTNINPLSHGHSVTFIYEPNNYAQQHMQNSIKFLRVHLLWSAPSGDDIIAKSLNVATHSAS